MQNKVSKIIHAAGFVGGVGLHKAHPGRVAMDNLRMGANVSRPPLAEEMSG
jgi:hypothetical protein